MITVKGVPEVVARVTALDNTVHGAAKLAVRDALAASKQAADRLTPIGSKSYTRLGETHPGYLLSRNQTRMITNGPELYVGEFYNDAPYALFVARGHHTRSGSWVHPRDFMTPAYGAGQRVIYSRMPGIL